MIITKKDVTGLLKKIDGRSNESIEINNIDSTGFLVFNLKGIDNPNNNEVFILLLEFVDRGVLTLEESKFLMRIVSFEHDSPEGIYCRLLEEDYDPKNSEECLMITIEKDFIGENVVIYYSDLGYSNREEFLTLPVDDQDKVINNWVMSHVN